jgi:DNA-binding transcriptional LysR family regulator
VAGNDLSRSNDVMTGIRRTNLGAVDLNLLKVLAALLEERNVTAAGRRVGLSQPAVSNALRRLRELLGDPLLVRSGSGGLELTAHAESLRDPVRRAVAALAETFSPPRAFEPATASLAVRLAATDLAALAVLPPLLALLAREAPGIDLVVRSGDRDQVLLWLREGVVDMALGVFPEPPAGALVEPLLREDFVLLLRPGHPLLEGELTPERLVAYPAVLVSPRGDPRGVADDALEALGLRRRVAVTVAHFLLAPHLLRGSDLTLVFPRTLAAGTGEALGLELRPLPLDVPPFTVQLLWLARTDRDPALAWLRGLVAQAAAAARR